MIDQSPPSPNNATQATGINAWWLIAYGVLIGLLAAGVIFLITSQPRGQAVSLSPPPTAHDLVVYVSGAVSRVGLYNLPAGSRVEAAIQAAGGLLPDADDQSINLAAYVLDEQKIFVSSRGTPIPLVTSTAIPTSTPTRGSYLIDINSATQADLESLPAIGPVFAQRILAYREKHGPFQSIDSLLKVSGITRDILAVIADYITANPPP